MRNATLIWAGILLVGVCAATSAERPMNGIDLELMATEKTSEIQSSLDQLTIDRDSFAKRISSAVRSSKTPQSKLTAIYLAGLYRIELAAPYLVESIDFQFNTDD